MAKENDLRIPGFKLVSGETPATLTVSSFGGPRTGKTRFLVTMPEPIAVVPLDKNTRWTIERAAKALGKRIVMPEEDFIRVAEPLKLAKMNLEESKKYYRALLDRVKTCYFQALESKAVRSVAIDSGTMLWELILFSEYGRSQRIMPRDRGPVNQSMRDLIGCCTNKHLVITHQAQEIWSGDGNDSKPTGELKPSGFTHISYSVNACVQHFKLTKRSEIRKALDLEPRDPTPTVLFGITCFDCQANPSLVKDDENSTLYAEGCCFQGLAAKVFPDEDIDLFS